MDSDEVTISDHHSSSAANHRLNLRLTDLKKAYADIILNTAKESAARILVSERKALRFQHELNVTKEQALQVLLRLKLMVDSKVCFEVLFGDNKKLALILN
ncbi:hypothetical protein CsSME_00006849 [Camellia sinensis var. sinensis]